MRRATRRPEASAFAGLQVRPSSGAEERLIAVDVVIGEVWHRFAHGWAEMIRKVYKVDPLICPRCGGRMRVVAFLIEYAVVDRIIRHLELTFAAEKPPPSRIFEQVALMAAEESGKYE